jgi:signal transduction histidine kinase/integral membrane sensor domain MASE1
VNASATAVWAPTGIALGGLLVFGGRVWPCIFLGAFLVNITTAGNVETSLGIALGNTLEGLAGAWLVNRFANGRHAFDRAQDVFKFTVLAAMWATMVSPIIGVTTLALGGLADWSDFGSIWLTWWVGDMSGALVVAPLVITCAANPLSDWNRAKVFEGAALLLGLIAAGWTIFGALPALEEYPLLFLSTPALVWIAFRFGQRETAIAIFILSAIAVWGTLRGVGPFALRKPHESLLFLQAFLGVIAVMSMTLSAAMSEHRASEQRLDAQQATMRIASESQTLAEALPAILQTVCEKLRWELGSFWRVDPAALCLEWLQTWVSPGISARAKNFIEASRHTRFAPGVGMPGRAWQVRGVIWVDDVVRDSNFPRAPFAEEAGLHSAFAFPVIVDGQVFGVMEFFTREWRGSRKELVAVIANIATQISQLMERKRAAVELERQKAAAEAANQAKDNFLAMLSHELRTPLSPVVFAIDDLEATLAPTSEAKPLLAMIRRNIEHEARLIDDLLDLTRVVKGKLDLQFAVLDAHGSILQALDFCGPEIRQKRIDVATELRATDHFVNADPTKLQQIIWNLVKNAVKFSAESGTIEISSENPSPDLLLIRVSDHGIGIEPGMLPRIFTPFEQGEDSIQRRFGGLGLGLTISKAIAEAHGGTLEASSAGRGHGASFTLSLSVIRGSELPTAPGTATKKGWAKSSANLRVLLVDDHEDTRCALERLLRRRGYQVGSAHDVSSALDLARRESFDIVVSDIGLPDRSGLELIRELQQNCSMKGIAMSGFGMEGDREKSKAAGFSEHLLKPVNFDELDATIRQIISKP